MKSEKEIRKELERCKKEYRIYEKKGDDNMMLVFLERMGGLEFALDEED